MKKILLNQGKVALVDDEDYPGLSQYKWSAFKHGNTYHVSRHAKSDLTKKYCAIYMHAAIIGTPKGFETDHINGDGLDNRRINLRITTTRENQQNRHTPKTSKFPGVCRFERTGKWRAYIKIGGKQHHLGLFDDEETAGIVYAMACNAIKNRATVV